MQKYDKRDANKTCEIFLDLGHACKTCETGV